MDFMKNYSSVFSGSNIDNNENKIVSKEPAQITIMQDSYNPTSSINNEKTIIKTDTGAKNGQDKCPKCGSTDISININNGKLRCNYCRYEFEPEKISGMVEDISQLQGQVIASGATDIIADTNDVLTFKCSSCGAQVVIDTASAPQARCHWCRNILSVNQQIPNGSIPDVVLPFNISKEIAQLEIKKFVAKRKFFANPQFKKEFTTENIMGVYFPYMLVDVNAHANFSGEGEIKIRSYTVDSGKETKTYYDADLYHIEREFDIAINGLSIESSLDKLKQLGSNTNNIINSIMPFDIENSVKYNANYLRGYTSEKRDVNIEQLRKIVEIQSEDITRFAANDTLKEYDRGIQWSKEQYNIKGEQWKSAYLPVWLYSFQEVKKNKKVLHYVAVNARTKEVMGSIPIHMPKLIGISVLIEVLIIVVINRGHLISPFFLLPGIIFFFTMYFKYSNIDARHTYETETKRNITNVRKVDTFIKRMKGISNPYMGGANNKKVNGQYIDNLISDPASSNKSNLNQDSVNKGAKQ